MTPASAKPVEHHRGLAALLACLSAVGPFSIDAYLPSMGEIGRVLHADPLAVQQTLTAYMVPFAIMTLWHGAISDALGRRRVILWGIVLFGLASVCCALAQNIRMLIVFRVLQGMTAGTGMVVGRAIVRDRFHGAEAQRVMSQITLTFALAPALAPVIGGWLEVAFGWRAVFVFLVLFCIGLLLLCHYVLDETLPPARRQPLHPGYLARSYWGVLTSVRFLALSLTSTLIFSGFFLYVTAAPVFLMRHLQVPVTGFLWLFGPATIGMALGAFTSGRVAGRFSPRRTLTLAFSLMAAAALGNVLINLLMAPRLPWAVLPIFFYVFGMSLAMPTLTLLTLDLFPAQRGLAASCLSFVQMAVSALNAIAAPLVWGSTRSLALTSAAALAAGLVALLIGRVPAAFAPPTRIAEPVT